MLAFFKLLLLLIGRVRGVSPLHMIICFFLFSITQLFTHIILFLVLVCPFLFISLLFGEIHFIFSEYFKDQFKLYFALLCSTPVVMKYENDLNCQVLI